MARTFHELWRDLEERSKRFSIPIVQDYKELEHIFNLMNGCKSYLEIGAAEGNSLYVLSHALTDNAMVWAIDFGEKHTELAREEVIKDIKSRLYDATDPSIYLTLNNSHNTTCLRELYHHHVIFDCVLIDAGHTYEDVIADAVAYGHLATKYIFFHDIQIPDVRRAYEWYLAQNPQFKHYEFINSTDYGYGIVTV